MFLVFITSWQHSYNRTVYISVCNILGNVLQCFTKIIKNLGEALVLTVLAPDARVVALFKP